jgi:hypothetical protein
MGKTEAYFIASVYDDLYKFDWPVLIERGTLCLWLDVSNLREHFGGLLEEVGRDLTEFEVTKVVGGERADIEGCRFVRAHDLRNVKLQDPVLNTNFELILNQFLWTQLPLFLNEHIDSLSLVSIFDIKDFWDELKLLEHFKKYWLFRYKIVVMRYENEKKLRELELKVDTKSGEGVSTLKTEVGKLEVNAEGEAEVLKKVESADLGITENSSTSTPLPDANLKLEDDSEVTSTTSLSVPENKNAQSISKNFIDTLNNTELKLITSLMDNIEVQFKGLQEYDGAVRLQTTSAFLTLLRGTVGLLEHLLLWS